MMTTENAKPNEFAPWMGVALSQIFVKERLADGTLNPKIHEYFAATTFKQGDGDDAWCSALGCWCLEYVHVKSPRSAAARDWLKWGKVVPIGEAREGDALIFDRKSPGNPRAAHLGFYCGETPTTYTIIAGNMSNQVCIRAYDKKILLGIRRPA